MCRLQANFPATIAMARTSGQKNFFVKKPSILKSFQLKTTSWISLKHSQTNLSTQNTQKWDKKPEIKSV
jgi:hypothetical protein